MSLAFAQIENLVSLKDASLILGISESGLREFIQKGKIKVSFMPGGEIGINPELTGIILLNARLMEITRGLFAHLENSWISISDAETRYNIPNSTIRSWLSRDYCRTDISTYPAKICEADIAYLTAIYNERRSKGLQNGAPLLDKDGLPYLLKRPSLSEYRRRKKANK